MRRLILLRHAKSDWSAGGPDHDRELAPRGREAASRIGVYMARHALIPDLVLCSSARRSRETWDIVARALPKPPAIRYDQRIYEVGAAAILEVVKEAKPEVHVLQVVGHNPGLRDLAEDLIAAGDVDLRQRLLEKFPTAGLAVIDCPIDDWARLRPRAGRLDRFIAPRQLEAATD